MSKIVDIKAREIIDSRGNPTVEADVFLESGAFGRASVPSGASKGIHEAIELRDENNKRFFGKGVLRAIDNINKIIKPKLIGKYADEQRFIDNELLFLDGSENKANLGANAVLAVSLGVAKAMACEKKMPLYKYLGGDDARILPVPMMNILNGGKHADNMLDIQEFMIMPVGAESIKESIRMGGEIFYVLKKILKNNGYNTNVGDEGGFAPNISSTKEALDLIICAIKEAGYDVIKDVVIAIDVASSEFFSSGKYTMSGENRSFFIKELVDFYKEICNEYPIYSIEDGMAEDDWEGWKLLTKELGNKIQIVGDDLFVTNPKRLKTGIEKNIANAVLIKVNQIGTLTEAIDTVDIAFSNNYNAILSHRSGETEDTTIADIAVATNCGQIKTGSLSRTDRVAKYNQLIRIEEELGDKAIFASKRIFKKGT